MPSPIEIFLPVRNGGAYLSEALASIVEQRDSNWRLHILDNASTDDTIQRVRSFGDPRIVVVPSAAPLSIEQSWARILDGCRALDPQVLVTFVGHDDILYPEFVATLRRLAAEDPTATLYQTHIDLIDGEGRVIRQIRPVAQLEQADDLLAALCWGIRDSFGTGYACRAGDYVAVGGIPGFPNLLYSDHLLFTRLTRLGHKHAAPSVDCAYRLHLGSVSNRFSREHLEALIASLSLFVAALDAEFDDFLASARGRFALVELLRRELRVYDTVIVRRVLACPAVSKAVALRARLADLDPDHRSFRPISSSPASRLKSWREQLGPLRLLRR